MVIGFPDRQPFAAAAQPVYDAFCPRNEWGRDLIERIRSAREA